MFQISFTECLLLSQSPAPDGAGLFPDWSSNFTGHEKRGTLPDDGAGKKLLIYFSTSLKSNEAVLKRILRSKPLKMNEEDAEFLEDVIIENKQAMEMSHILPAYPERHDPGICHIFRTISILS